MIENDPDQSEPCVKGAPVRPHSSLHNFSNISLQPVETTCPNGEVGTGQSGMDGDEVDGEADLHEEHGARVKPGPPEPTPQDRDHHETSGHVVYRSWCGPCVSGRGRALSHSGKDHQHDETAVIS